jgi:hypothetical protein
MNLIDRLIDLARRTPYFHLYHADGTIYMERYWIVPSARPGSASKAGCYVATWRQPIRWILQKLGIAVRLHCIHTPDLDRAMHDHPWTFISVVLRGWYIEARPLRPESFLPTSSDPEEEMEQSHPRAAGGYALRRFYHRHKITAVSPGGVWTLFVTFRKRQPWGFYTPGGKIWWQVFESVHNNRPVQ